MVEMFFNNIFFNFLINLNLSIKMQSESFVLCKFILINIWAYII